jgi:hypothetical protein
MMYGETNLKHSISNLFPWYKQMSTESPVIYDKDFLHYFGSKGAWHWELL